MPGADRSHYLLNLYQLPVSDFRRPKRTAQLGPLVAYIGSGYNTSGYYEAMKSLYQSLLDYEMTLLKAIAERRAVPLQTSNKSDAVKLITEALLSPAIMAIALADMSTAELEALQFILDKGGQVEGPRFAREYGLIRPMGSARMARERPWQNPVNVAESLWYQGFIFKAFQLTGQGNLEMVYVPGDLLSLLQISPLRTTPNPVPVQDPDTRANGIEVLSTPPPDRILSGDNRLQENIFSLLIHLQTIPVRMGNNSQLMPEDRQRLLKCLLPPLLPTFTPEAELEFLLHLGQRAGLLLLRHGRLKPDPNPARAWLQASPSHQLLQLQNTWRADPTWNDLWHVPGLAPQPTGWENSTLLARSKILDYLVSSGASPDTWLSLASFIETIKRIEPDFQRPDGNYESWYIQDAAGNYLMGFANWDRIDGALIRYLVTHMLLLLNVVELGCGAGRPESVSAPDVFRLTEPGKIFLAGSQAPLPPDKPPLLLRVDSNFYAHVPARSSLYDRFQLARFADLDRREQDRVIYHITRASVNRALRNGVTADQIAAFLARATNNQTPLKVVETLRAWGSRRATVMMERATLLRVEREDITEELRRHPLLGPLLGEQLSPRVLLVPANNVAEVRRLLAEAGYLAELE